METHGEEFQKIEATLLANDVAARIKILKQAKAIKIQRSDLPSLLLGTLFLVLAYWEYKSLNTSESRVVFPAIFFVLGITFINQTFFIVVFRRLDALVQLFENLQMRKS